MLLIGRVAIAMPLVLSVTMGIASHCLSQQDSKAHPMGINYILLACTAGAFAQCATGMGKTDASFVLGEIFPLPNT